MQPEAEMELVTGAAGRVELVGPRQRPRIEHGGVGDGEHRGPLGQPGFVGFAATEHRVIVLDGAEEIRKRRLKPQRLPDEAIDRCGVLAHGGGARFGEIIRPLHEKVEHVDHAMRGGLDSADQQPGGVEDDPLQVEPERMGRCELQQPRHRIVLVQP